MKDRRGIALVQVLAMALLALLLCAVIVETRLQPAVSAANAVDRLRDDLSEQAALNRVTAAWAAVGTCSSSASAGVSCAGSGCDCTCTVDGAARVSSVSKSGGACSLSLAP